MTNDKQPNNRIANRKTLNHVVGDDFISALDFAKRVETDSTLSLITNDEQFGSLIWDVTCILSNTTLGFIDLKEII